MSINSQHVETRQLREARRLLAEWRARLRGVPDESTGDAPDAVGPVVLDEHYLRAANAVMTLQEMELGWRRAWREVEDRFVHLATRWRAEQGMARSGSGKLSGRGSGTDSGSSSSR